MTSRRGRRHRVQDLGVAVLLAAVGLLEVWLPLESAVGQGSPWVSTVGIVTVAALLTARRTHPPACFVAIAVWPVLGVLTWGDLQILFFGQLVPLMVIVYSVARHGQGRQPWVGAAAAAGMMVLADVFIQLLQDPGELFFHWGALTLSFLVGRGLRTSEDRAVAAALHAAEAETAARERTAAAIAEERARIARELHDIVAHSVSVIVVQAGAAEQVVDDDPELARRALRTIRTTGTGALGEMRRVVAMLRVPETAGDLTPQPGVAALPGLVDATRATGLDVDLRVKGTPVLLPAGLDLAAYRIVQEALTNVRRHSDATHAGVALAFTPSQLEIDVEDNGTSCSEVRAGHGLIGMRERAALYGGRCEAAMTEAGFQVHAVLPVEPA
jgi:signal transduction histidine kinase